MPVTPAGDGRGGSVDRDFILGRGMQLPPKFRPVIGLIDVVDRPRIRHRVVAARIAPNETKRAASPDAIVLMSAVDVRKIHQLVGFVLHEYAVVLAVGPLALRRSAALAVNERDVVAILLHVVSAGPDREVFTQSTDAEVAGTRVEMALCRGGALRGVERHKSRVVAP